VSVYTATSSGAHTGTGSSPITVSGLSNGTAYTFTVTATNANGTSTASSASNSVTPTAPAPTFFSASGTFTPNYYPFNYTAYAVGAGGGQGGGCDSLTSAANINYKRFSVGAGGGAGGGYQSVGVGGVGGGGNAGFAGTTNTGGGGGGYRQDPGNLDGGAGGSGIVIVSYPDIYAGAASTTGSPTVSTSGSGSANFTGATNQGLVYTIPGSINSLSGNFTIEYWLYSTAYGSYPTTISNYPTQATYIIHQYGPSSSQTFGIGTSAGTIGSVTTSPNTWYHIAMVRSGSTITAYVNGTSVGTQSNSTTYNLATLGVGNYTTTAGSYPFYGNISNLRITNTAVYTGNFTPSTTPLTAISGTLFLLNTVSGAPFADGSTNAASVALLSSSVASPTWNQASPFATGLGYKNRVYTWTSSGSITF
jgi:hypothetical protein